MSSDYIIDIIVISEYGTYLYSSLGVSVISNKIDFN